MKKGIWEGLPPAKPLLLHDSCRSKAPRGGIGCIPRDCSQCKQRINRALMLCTNCAETSNCCQLCGKSLNGSVSTPINQAAGPSGVSLKPFAVTHISCSKIPLPVSTRAGRCECGVFVSSNAIKLCDSCSQLSRRCNRCGKKVRTQKTPVAGVDKPTDKPEQAPKSSRKRGR